MERVSLTHMAMPRAMPIIASVVRNDGIPTRVVMTPFATPITSPVANPPRMPKSGPPMSIAIAVATDASPASAPTDRSISPAERTNVMATAITAMTAVCRTMFRRLVGSRNPLSCRVSAKKMKMPIKPR